MNEIESYTRYIQELVEQEKYTNALILFEETHEKFSPNEISQNQYLIKSLLKAFRKVDRSLDGLAFIDDFNVDITVFNDKYTLSAYGWLLYSALKASYVLPTAESEGLVERVVEFLPSINIKEGFNTRLFQLLFQQIIKLERKKTPPNVVRVFEILKAINIREIDEAKELVKDDPFLVSGILTILRKSNQLSRAFSFLNFLQIEISHETPTQIIDAYGWMVYTKVKTENQDVNEEHPEEAFDSLLYDLDHDHNGVSGRDNRTETAELVLDIIPLLNPKSEYGAFSRLFRLVLKSEKLRPNTNWQYLSDLLNLIPPNTLSQECETVEFKRRGKKKQMELASDCESWYAAYTQVLMQLGHYQECITLSKSALDMFDRFHYGNDVWFARKIAKCQKELGNVEDSIKDMEEVERRKSEWFVQKELAELYFEQNEITKSKNMATKAALSYGDKEKKDGVYFLLGQIYKEQGKMEIAHKHFLLSLMIREEEDWKIPHKLKLELKETKPEGFLQKHESSSALFKELLKIWKGNSPIPKKKKRIVKPNFKSTYGNISHMRKDKGFGFIVGDNKQEYFFRANGVKADFSTLEEGLKVRFKCKPPKSEVEGKKWTAYEIIVVK